MPSFEYLWTSISSDNPLMRARRLLLALTALGAGAMPLGCAPDPEPDSHEPIVGIPSRSPLPALPTPTETIAPTPTLSPTPTPTPDPTPTPIQTRTVVVELLNVRGEPIPGIHVVSTLVDTILDVSMTDLYGTASIEVSDGGHVTAIADATTGRFSVTVDVPDGPLVRMRSAFANSSTPMERVAVTGALPGESVRAFTAGGPGHDGTMPSDGTPFVVDAITSTWSYQNDGRFVAGATMGPVTNPTQWGMAVDVPSGQTAGVVLRSTNDSPLLSVEQTNIAACDAWQTAVGYERQNARLYPAASAAYSTSAATISLRPWGADLADAVLTFGGCNRASGEVFVSMRGRPLGVSTLVVDRLPRVPGVAGVTGTRIDGRPALTWTSTGEAASADYVGGFAFWTTSTGERRSWEFRLRSRSAGTQTIVHPPLPEDLAALLSGLGEPQGVIHSVDADFANGYSDAWKFQTRPRSSSFELQYSFDSTPGGFYSPLPF